MKAVGQNRILVIDEDTRQAEALIMRLGDAGYEVDIASGGEDGLRLAEQKLYEVIILDTVLPGLKGMDMCEYLRNKGIVTPILMISDCCEKISLIRGLELGADDYLMNPFSHKELIARTRAMVRRNHKTFGSFWAQKYGVELDFVSSTAHANERTVKLTKKEALLLRKLMVEAPEPVSRTVLLQDVWGIDDLHTSNRLDVYIRRLRWKLEQLTDQTLIHTVRGQGYYFSRNSSSE